jgi:membrane protease YdiL (CAAX protease family)
VRRSLGFLEVLGFYGTAFIAIWGGQRLPWRPPVLLAGVLIVGICVLSNRRHGDTRERLGLDPRWLKPCAKTTAWVAGPFLIVLLAIALGGPSPTPRQFLFWLLGYPLWAFAQEYALLAFSGNRLSDSFGDRPWTVAIVNGLLFSLVHAPNPILMTACLISGALFTRIFLRTPHLFPLALAHGWGGFLLSWIYLMKYNAMMIGPAYLKHAATLGPHP